MLTLAGMELTFDSLLETGGEADWLKTINLGVVGNRASSAKGGMAICAPWHPWAFSCCAVRCVSIGKASTDHCCNGNGQLQGPAGNILCLSEKQAQDFGAEISINLCYKVLSTTLDLKAAETTLGWWLPFSLLLLALSLLLSFSFSFLFLHFFFSKYAIRWTKKNYNQ